MKRPSENGSHSEQQDPLLQLPLVPSGLSQTVDFLPAQIERSQAGAESDVGGSENDQTVISLVPVAAPEEFYRSMPLSELAEMLEGRQLDHFQVDQMIGGGGMGAVFRGRDLRLDRVVAIKVIPSAKRDADTLRRFRLEAQAAAKLDHPNIARVFYVGEAEQWNYIVFEFIDGINIRDLVEMEGPLSVDDAVYYTRQVAEALQHAHDREVVHRDIKPSNVLVTAGGAAKVVDMGLARHTAMDKSSADATASGVTLGTFDYISPEQARNPRDADVRSDMYSLGCTLFYMLTGCAPFPEGTALQKLLSHGSQPPPDPRAWREDLSDELYEITMKLMAKRPVERYQRPSDLIGDLIMLAEVEGLPRSQSPCTVLVSPSMSQRSLAEANLPWLVAFGALLVSTMWLEIVQSQSNDFKLAELQFKTPQDSSQLGKNETANSSLPAEGLVNSPASLPASSLRSAENRLPTSPSDLPRAFQGDGQRPDDPPSASSSSENGQVIETEKQLGPPVPKVMSSKKNNGDLTGPDFGELRSFVNEGYADNRFSIFPPQSRANASDGGLALASSGSVSTSAASSSTNPQPPRGANNQAGFSSSANLSSNAGSDSGASDRKPNSEPTSRSKPTTPELIIASRERPLGVDLNLWESSLADALAKVSILGGSHTIEVRGRHVLTEATFLDSTDLSLVAGPATDDERASIEINDRMIWRNGPSVGVFVLDDSSIGMQGLDIEITVQKDWIGPQQSLFAIDGNSRIDLDNCDIKVTDAVDADRFTVVAAGTNPLLLDPRDLLESEEEQEASMLVRATGSVVRGETTFLGLSTTEKTFSDRFDVSLFDTLIAVSGSVLSVKAPTGDTKSQRFVRVLSNQSTFVTRRAYARLEYYGGAAPLLGLVRTSQSCVYWSSSDMPHVEIFGARRQSMLGNFSLLTLQGSNNRYDAATQDICRAYLGSERIATFGFAEASASGWLGERGNDAMVPWRSPSTPLFPLHNARPEDFALSDMISGAGISIDIDRP